MECEADRSIPYSKGAYNKSDDKEQWIRLTEGCPNRCPFCRESFENPEANHFEIPEIIRNKVKIMDMNLLANLGLWYIKKLAKIKVDNKVVYYELVCGIDYRYVTSQVAKSLKEARFINLRIAWDFGFEYQKKIKAVIYYLIDAGYAPKDIMVFIICNWKISYEENLRKIDLCKVWNVQMGDCYFDNQLSPNIKPIHWEEWQIKDFRKRIRKHNQLVNFGIDPECTEINEKQDTLFKVY